MSLFDKDGVHVAGRKVPGWLIGALIAGAGLLIFLRARSGGGQVALGAQPAAQTGYAATGADVSGSLAALTTAIQAEQQAITQGFQGLNQAPVATGPPPVTTPPPTTVPPAAWPWSPGMKATTPFLEIAAYEYYHGHGTPPPGIAASTLGSLTDAQKTLLGIAPSYIPQQPAAPTAPTRFLGPPIVAGGFGSTGGNNFGSASK